MPMNDAAKTLTVRLSKTMRQKLDRFSAERNVSRAVLVKDALQAYLASLDGKEAAAKRAEASALRAAAWKDFLASASSEARGTQGRSMEDIDKMIDDIRADR